MARVVITGFGAVTPLGNTFKESWEAVKAGRSGIGPITKFDASLLPWKVAGEVRNFDAGTVLHGKEIRRLDPFIHYAVVAAAEAAEDADLPQSGIRRRGDSAGSAQYLASGGVIIGSSRGGISTFERAVRERRASPSKARATRPSAYLMPATTIGMGASSIAQKLGLKGYALGISNACASGTNAVGEAYRLIKAGFGGPVFAGGADAPLCSVCLEGYGASGVLSKTADLSASRPFDRSRDGFVLSEGACVMVLEGLDGALQRGARIYGEIRGYANTIDALHQTRPGKEGEVEGMRSALADAHITPGDVDFVSAHGTSTGIGDKVEAEAIADVFGEDLPVTAIKAATGHLLGASGALETAFAVMSLREKIIPATINLREKDRGCGIRVITETTRVEIGTAISNSFGFGGVNAVLVLAAFPPETGYV